MPAHANLKGTPIASDSHTAPHLGFHDVDSSLTWNGVADALEHGHTLPRATHEDVYLEHSNKGYFTRSALIPGLGLATKSMTVFPDNRNKVPALPSIQGAVMLFDDVSGGLLAVLDGELITKWKTTGDSMLAARLLARPESKNLVLVGAGTVGRYSLEAYSELFPHLEKISIWNRTPQTAQALAQRFADHDSAEVRAIENLEAAVADADIISCATMSPTPVLKGAWVPPGCHVDLVGAFRPHMREADDELLLASKVYVDSRRSTFEDIGEIAIPLSAGTITEQHVLGDYYDLCLSPPVRDTNDITLFKNGGGGHLDLMCSHHVYKTYMDAKA